MLEVLTTKRCPSREVWSGFYAGKVESDSVAELATHLDSCPSCQLLLQVIADSTADEPDPLIAGLRAVSPEADEYQDEPACQLALEKIQALVSQDRSLQTVPERLGEYQIIGLLGRGGMGAVYRAIHTRLGREVALKVVSPDRVSVASPARFQRETRAHGKIDHPNVVRATDAGEVDGIAYLVMDLVDGIALDQLIQERGAILVADACEITRQAAIGLQHLAEHGLVHRDVKPSNLMLNRRGEVKVLDLGLIAAVDLNPDDSPLTDGKVVGTFDYIAPEQAEPNGPVDARTDIYSLGCVLFFLLTGKPPYPGPTYATARAKILAHSSGPIPDVRDMRAEIPAGLSAIITRMLAKDPADRFATPRDVAVALTPFCVGSTLANIESLIPPTVASVPSSGSSHRTRGTRYRIVASLLAILLIGGGLGAAVRYWILSPNTAIREELPKPEPQPPETPQAAVNAQLKVVYPVALLNFERDAGAKLSDLLFAKLSAKPEFYLVDRTDLKKVLDEQALSLGGAVKADEAVKVGQLTGAKIIVTGSVIQENKKLYLIAKIISTETGRVLGTSVEGAASDDLSDLAKKLADAIDEKVNKEGNRLVPKPVAAVDRIGELNKKLGKGERPVLMIQVSERHIGRPAVDPAAQTELSKYAKDCGFELVDADEAGKGKADVIITGEGFSEVASRMGNLVSVRARVEVKAVDRKTGKVLATDRQTVLLVDLSEQVAGKTALQNAAADLAERILPKLVVKK